MRKRLNEAVGRLRDAVSEPPAIVPPHPYVSAAAPLPPPGSHLPPGPFPSTQPAPAAPLPRPNVPPPMGEPPPSAWALSNPIIDRPSAPDPWVIHHDDWYYLTFTSGGDVTLYRSRGCDFVGAPPRTVYRPPTDTAGRPVFHDLWAPELHFVDGRWYIYFAMAPVAGGGGHRMYVLESDAAGPNADPWACSFNMAGQLATGAPGTPDAEAWAIDGTLLQVPPPARGAPPGSGAQLFFVWSGTRVGVLGQQLYIARMADPRSLASRRALVAAPSAPWECCGRPIMEGPTALYHAGRAYLLYSASASWTPDYCLGLLALAPGADPMAPAAWTKAPGPVFCRNDAARVWNVGHASSTVSPDGLEQWLVYHAQSQPNGGWEGRSARVQRYVWRPDGLPDFGRPLPLPPPPAPL